MKSRYLSLGVIAVIFVFCLTTFMAILVEARGGRGGGHRGGGGFKRGGAASGGGFSSRSASHKSARQAPRQETRRQQKPRTSDRDTGDRQDNRDDAREDRQEHLDDAREDRQQHRANMYDEIEDDREDRWDDYHDRRVGAALMTGVAVGAAASHNYVTYMPCNTTVIVGAVTYYHCDSVWYSRGSEGGEVVYIVTSAPAGY